MQGIADAYEVVNVAVLSVENRQHVLQSGRLVGISDGRESWGLGLIVKAYSPAGKKKGQCVVDVLLQCAPGTETSEHITSGFLIPQPTYCYASFLLNGLCKGFTLQYIPVYLYAFHAFLALTDLINRPRCPSE